MESGQITGQGRTGTGELRLPLFISQAHSWGKMRTADITEGLPVSPSSLHSCVLPCCSLSSASFSHLSPRLSHLPAPPTSPAPPISVSLQSRGFPSLRVDLLCLPTILSLNAGGYLCAQTPGSPSFIQNLWFTAQGRVSLIQNEMKAMRVVVWWSNLLRYQPMGASPPQRGVEARGGTTPRWWAKLRAVILHLPWAGERLWGSPEHGHLDFGPRPSCLFCVLLPCVQNVLMTSGLPAAAPWRPIAQHSGVPVQSQ